MLMKTKAEDGEFLVSARSIHAALGIKSQYSDWVRRRGVVTGEDSLDAWVPYHKALEIILQSHGVKAAEIRRDIVDGKRIGKYFEE